MTGFDRVAVRLDGVGSATLPQVARRKPCVLRLDPRIAMTLMPCFHNSLRRSGLGQKCAAQAIEQVGNHGEIFERELAPLGISRGQHAPWTKDGLEYSPPFR